MHACKTDRFKHPFLPQMIFKENSRISFLYNLVILVFITFILIVICNIVSITLFSHCFTLL